MAWFFFILGSGTAILCIITGFTVTGLTVICGLSFVASAIYEVASSVRQLIKVLNGPARQSLLLPKKLKQNPVTEAEPPAASQGTGL